LSVVISVEFLCLVAWHHTHHLKRVSNSLEA